MRYHLLSAAALCLLAATAFGQRAKVTRQTVFTDVDGRVITKEAYKEKLRSGQFAVDKAQASGRTFTSISLKPAGAPDAVRPQALTPQRAFHTAAPSFRVTDLQGRPFSTEALRGKVVVLNFWFVNCPYCIEEMPAFKQLTAAYQPQQDAVVFLSFALDKPERLQQFLQQRGDFGFAIVPAAKPIAQQFAVSAYPTTVVLDKQGQFVYDQEYSDSTARLQEAIQRALHQ